MLLIFIGIQPLSYAESHDHDNTPDELEPYVTDLQVINNSSFNIEAQWYTQENSPIPKLPKCTSQQKVIKKSWFFIPPTKWGNYKFNVFSTPCGEYVEIKILDNNNNIIDHLISENMYKGRSGNWTCFVSKQTGFSLHCKKD